MQTQTPIASVLSKIDFAISYSPTVELMACLHAISDLQNHRDIQPYADAVLKTMPPDRIEQLQTFSKDTLNWRLAMDLSCLFEQKEIDSVTYFFHSLDAVDSAEFAALMLSGLISADEVRALRKSKKALDSWDYQQITPFVDPKLAYKFITDDGSMRHELVSFLSWFWSVYFSKEWNRIGIFEMDAINTERQLLNVLGPLRYLESCHEYLELGNTTIAAKDRPWLSYPIKTLKKVRVILSAYVAPHLMLNHVDGELTVYKAINITQKPSALASTVIFKFLKAIDSRTKLLILQHLKDHPKTGKELADLLNVAPSTISVHLKALRDAELIYPNPVGNAVYYHFLKENYHAQLAYLEGIFETKFL